MPRTAIAFGSIAPDLVPMPIEPSWIVDGDPVARAAELSRSRDGTACTMVWKCTPGRFDWHYGTDETIHLLEGSVLLDDGVAPPRRLGPGDVVFFPAGAVVRWTVETRVRKLAFFRRALPAPVAVLTRTLVSSEHTMRERRSRARMAAVASSKAGLVRRNMASSAPSLTTNPNRCSNRRRRRT